MGGIDNINANWTTIFAEVFNHMSAGSNDFVTQAWDSALCKDRFWIFILFRYSLYQHSKTVHSKYSLRFRMTIALRLPEMLTNISLSPWIYFRVWSLLRIAVFLGSQGSLSSSLGCSFLSMHRNKERKWTMLTDKNEEAYTSKNS